MQYDLEMLGTRQLNDLVRQGHLGVQDLQQWLEVQGGSPTALGVGPAADLFYGEGVGGTLAPSQSMLPAVPMVAGAAVVVTLAMLVARYGTLIGTGVWTALRGLGVAGRVQWSRLPGWLKTALAFLGISEGGELILEGLDDGVDLLPLPGWPWGGGGAPDHPAAQLHGGVVKSWRPTGNLWMARYADGYMGAQRKDGTWTTWKPKKPIVIFTNGSKDIRESIRAFTASSKQLAKVSKSAQKLYKTKTVYRCPKCRKDPCCC